MYMMTEGHWWSDRVEIPNELLQRSRLGGVALKRNWIWPGNTVSWRFDRPDAAEQVAILVQHATPSEFTVTAFNTAGRPIAAQMTGWNVTAGEWQADAAGQAPRRFAFEKSASTPLTFPAGESSFQFHLVTAGPRTESRPDLGIGADDVVLKGGALTVTVHSLGALDAPVGTVEALDAAGKPIAHAAVPPLKAPTDLKPKTAAVRLTLPAGAKPTRVRVSLPDGVAEVTQLNNEIPLP
jgi:hypothetical protein